MNRENSPRLLKNKEQESLVGEIRVEKGWTLRRLALLSGVTTNQITDLQNGILSPVSKNGLTRAAKKLCDVLGYPPEIVFPRYFCDMNRAQLLDTQILDITVGSYAFPAVQDKYKAELSLIEKSPEECSLIIRHYLNGETLLKIATELGISRQRVQQKLNKQVEKLQKKLGIGIKGRGINNITAQWRRH